MTAHHEPNRGHGGRCPKASREGTRGIWVTVLPRVLWGFRRGRRDCVGWSHDRRSAGEVARCWRRGLAGLVSGVRC